MTFTHLTLAALTTCLVFQLPQASPVAGTKQESETFKTLAGSYLQGTDYVSTSLHIDTEGRFRFRWRAHDGGSHREEGKVEIIDGLVVLHPEKVETDWKPGTFPHPKYRAVRWGERLYLISDERMATFCNMVNLGIEPRSKCLGKEFIRFTSTEKSRKGEEQPVLGEIQGQPKVPADWEKHLLKRPIEGEILEGLDDRCARIDLGSNDGLVKGMELLVASGKPEAPKEVAIVVVVEVRAKDCNVKAKRRPQDIDRFEKGQNVYSKIPAPCMRKIMHDVSLIW
jgi:hypothetical protein